MAKSKTVANNLETNKPKKKAPTRGWKPGQSGNPKGRPKDGESWAAIIKEMSEMTADDILSIVGKNNDLGAAYALLPKNVQMKKLITARVMAALMFEPTSNLWNGLMERAEGKVPDKLDANVKLTSWEEFIKGAGDVDQK